MKKMLFLFLLGAAVLPRCFSQNMLIAGAEYNPFTPGFWSAGIGFNLGLFNEHIQDDLMLNFGNITTDSGEPYKFMVSVRDKLYFSYDWKIAGLRAGVSASLGVYESPLFPQSTNLLFDIAGFAGIVLFPKSLISVTVDLCPGYAVVFHVTDSPAAAFDRKGSMLPISLGIRLNLDKL